MNVIPSIYNAMLDQVEDYAIVFLDETGHVKNWSKGARMMMGYDDDEIIGRYIGVFYNREDRMSGVPEKVLAAALKKGVLKFEGVRLRKDGSRFWGDVLLTAIRDESNVHSGFSVIIRDMTEAQVQREFDLSNLNALINNTTDSMWSVDRDYRLITGNHTFDKMVQEISGRRINKGDSVLAIGFDKERLARFKDYYDRAFTGVAFTEIEYNALPEESWTEISYSPIWKDGKVAGAACHGHNITNRMLNERRIKHLNRLYAFVSKVNQAIVYADSEAMLFQSACTIAIDQGEFKAVWVGLIDPEYKTISLVAEKGLDPAIAAGFTTIPYEPNGPTEHVMNNQSYYVCNNIQRDFVLNNWKTFAVSNGYGSCIVLPIRKSGAIVGTINLYAADVDFFNDEEIALLEKAAVDISFALDVFETEKLRRQAEEKLKHNERRLKQAQEIAHMGSWEYDMATGIMIWSEEACRIYGLDTWDNKHTMESWLRFVHPDDMAFVAELTKGMETTRANASFYHRIIRKDGVLRNIHSQALFEFDSNGIPTGLYGVAHDITEQLANITRLKLQNEQLQDIAWIQAHKVRGPLATILGLGQLFQGSKTEEENRIIIEGIIFSSQKLDEVIREIVNKTTPSEISNAYGPLIV